MLDDGLKFLIEDELRIFIFAGAADVVAPRRKFFAPFLGRHRIFISHVIHGAAEGVERGHRIAFFAGQKNESEREIGGAFFGERATMLHD